MAIEEGYSESEKEEKRSLIEKEKDMESERVEVDQGEISPVRQVNIHRKIPKPC